MENIKIVAISSDITIYIYFVGLWIKFVLFLYIPGTEILKHLMYGSFLEKRTISVQKFEKKNSN